MGLESALGTADAGTSGHRGWGSKVRYRLGQKEEGLCGQADSGSCPLLSFPS